MTQRSIVRLAVAAAMFLPMTLGAQTFAPKPFDSQTFVQKPPVQASLSVTFTPGVAQPARLQYTSATENIEVKAETAKLTQDAGGVTVEMGFGEFSGTFTTEPWQYRTKDTFKSLVLTFGPRRELITRKHSKE